MTLAEARAAVVARVPSEFIDMAIASIDPCLYATGDQLGSNRDFVASPGELWLGFIDLQPDRDWGHRALNVLVFTNGTVEVGPAQFPPIMSAGRRLQIIE